MGDEAREALEDAARLYEAAAEELDRAVDHCRTAPGHSRNREIPRPAAHAWAAKHCVLSP